MNLCTYDYIRQSDRSDDDDDLHDHYRCHYCHDKYFSAILISQLSTVKI